MKNIEKELTNELINLVDKNENKKYIVMFLHNIFKQFKYEERLYLSIRFNQFLYKVFKTIGFFKYYNLSYGIPDETSLIELSANEIKNKDKFVLDEIIFDNAYELIEYLDEKIF